MGKRAKKKQKHAKRARVKESGTDEWPTDVIIDWCGTELFVVGWTENGFPYGVPAEDLERDEDETTFGALADCDVELFADDLEHIIVGDVMSAIARGDRDVRRDARASIRAAMDEIYASLLSAFSPHDEQTRRHE